MMSSNCSLSQKGFQNPAPVHFSSIAVVADARLKHLLLLLALNCIKPAKENCEFRICHLEKFENCSCMKKLLQDFFVYADYRARFPLWTGVKICPTCSCVSYEATQKGVLMTARLQRATTPAPKLVGSPADRPLH